MLTSSFRLKSLIGCYLAEIHTKEEGQVVKGTENSQNNLVTGPWALNFFCKWLWF